MARTGNRELPTFFVIGAAKCGTTSLHGYLDLHPEISMSSIKEPDHFSAPEPGPDDNSIRSRDEYLALFRPGTKHRGESSTSYSSAAQSAGVSERVAAEIPKAKLIYLVRDPVDRVVSSIRQKLSARTGEFRHQSADVSIAEVLGDYSDPANRFAATSLYMDQIRVWLSHFPVEQLLVVDSDVLKSSRQEEMSRIFGFLGVQKEFWHDRIEVEQNRTENKGRLDDRYVRASRIRSVRWVIERLPRTTRRKLSQAARSVARQEWIPPDLDDALRSDLQEYFAPSVAELRQFTGQDFAGWSV